MSTQLPTLSARQYVQPLREGGSLPAIVSTDDGLWVVKFRGAGQGPKALIAEIICGVLARELGLPVPDLAIILASAQFGATEPDPEIQDLLRASTGVNVGLRYLDGAFNYAVAPAGDIIDAALAARIVWFDAFTTNPDRTSRNVNILISGRRPYLIDHGAALYAHHDWQSVDDQKTRTPFALIRRHALLTVADDITAIDAALAAAVTPDLLRHVVEQVPAALLCDDRVRGEFDSAHAARARYVDYLETRLTAPRSFAQEAEQARRSVRATPPEHLSARR